MDKQKSGELKNSKLVFQTHKKLNSWLTILLKMN